MATIISRNFCSHNCDLNDFRRKRYEIYALVRYVSMLTDFFEYPLPRFYLRKAEDIGDELSVLEIVAFRIKSEKYNVLHAKDGAEDRVYSTP